MIPKVCWYRSVPHIAIGLSELSSPFFPPQPKRPVFLLGKCRNQTLCSNPKLWTFKKKKKKKWKIIRQEKEITKPALTVMIKLHKFTMGLVCPSATFPYLALGFCPHLFFFFLLPIYNLYICTFLELLIFFLNIFLCSILSHNFFLDFFFYYWVCQSNGFLRKEDYTH